MAMPASIGLLGEYEQWGVKDYPSWSQTKFNYPISMNTVYVVSASRKQSWDDKTEYGCTVLNTGSQSLTFMGYQGTANIIIIGR